MSSPSAVIVRDSRLPALGGDDVSLMVSDGPSSVTYQSVTTPNPSSTNPIFDVQLPSVMTGLQRTLYWEMSGTFTITGTNFDKANWLDRNVIALRQFPLQSMCSSVEVTVNNSSVSIGSIGQIISGLLRVGNPAESGNGVQSGTASSPDMAAAYDDALRGLDSSPFRSTADVRPGDASWPPRTVGITDIDFASATTTTVSFTVREPIIVPPFGYTNDAREKAIYGVDQIQIKPNMGNFHRGLSLAIIPAASPANTPTVTSVTLAPTSQSVLAIFVTPNDRSLAAARADAQHFRYDFPQLNTYFSSITSGAVASGASVTGSSNSFQLPVIPEKLIIYATYSESDRSDPSQSLPDAFLPITSCQVQAGTRAGLLSGATEMDLWAMSYRNGAQLPFYIYQGLPQISGGNAAGNQVNGSGGPLVIDVAADLSLPEGMTPGMAAQWQFAVSNFTYRNNFSVELTSPRLVIIAVTGGYMTNLSGSSTIVAGGVSGLSDVALKHASAMSSMEFHQMMQQGGYGGSKIGDWFKKAAKSVYGDVIHPFYKKVVKPLGKDIADKVLEKGKQKIKGSGLQGGRALGGARMGRTQLYG